MDRDTGLVPSDTSPIDAMCEVTGGKKEAFLMYKNKITLKETFDSSTYSRDVTGQGKSGKTPAKSVKFSTLT